MNHQTDRILELARSKGVLRTRDVDSAGASRALLASLTDESKLLKLGRGLYVLPDRAASAYDTSPKWPRAAKMACYVCCPRCASTT